jgi:alanine dehydrogenase
MITLDGEAVTASFPMAEAVDLMRAALRAYSDGAVRQPVRHMVPGADGDVLAVMPAYLGVPNDSPYQGFGLKAIVVKPGNPARGLEAHVGLVLVFDPDTGAPRALLDGAAITAIRTAAVSAVATDLLALPDAGELAMLGSGVQARSHFEAMALVRDLRSARVWSRDSERARSFAAWATAHFKVDVTAVASPSAAARGADLVCTVTAAHEPLLHAADVGAGTHINAVGSSFPEARELGTDLVRRCAIFVDSRESALREAGDLVIPISEGRLAPEAIRAEVGEVLLGRGSGRGGEGDITLFKSLGLAVEDVISGFAVDRRARRTTVEKSHGP